MPAQLTLDGREVVLEAPAPTPAPAAPEPLFTLPEAPAGSLSLPLD